MELKDRLKEAREDAKLKQGELADRSGVDQTTISRLENGKHAGSGHIVKIARALGVDAHWLTTGEGSKTPAARDGGAAYEVNSNVAPAPEPPSYHRYPVIGYGQAGEWTEAVAPYEPGAEPHQEATDYRAHGRAFWLEIKGDSMTAPAGVRPSVPEGTLVLFDTGAEPLPGKLVVALLEGSGEATFKQLIEDGGRRYLRAMNPAYPLIEINGNCRILGVAVEARMRL